MTWIDLTDIDGNSVWIRPDDIVLLASNYKDGDTRVGIKGLPTYVVVKDSKEFISQTMIDCRNAEAQL